MPATTMDIGLARAILPAMSTSDIGLEVLAADGVSGTAMIGAVVAGAAALGTIRRMHEPRWWETEVIRGGGNMTTEQYRLWRMYLELDQARMRAIERAYEDPGSIKIPEGEEWTPIAALYVVRDQARDDAQEMSDMAHAMAAQAGVPGFT